MTTDSRIPSRKFGPNFAPSRELYQHVRASVEAEPASTTSVPARVIVALAIASSVTAAIILLASQVVYQRLAVGVYVAAQSAPHVLVVLLLLIALTLAATVAAVWRGRHGLGSSVVSLFTIAGLVAPLYAALVLIDPVHAHDPALASAISPWGVRCFTIASTVGVVVLASLTIALRGSVPVASRLRGAALGAAAGAWAGLSVFIFCPSSDQQHMLAGHVLPIAVMTLLGIVGVPRVLRP